MGPFLEQLQQYILFLGLSRQQVRWRDDVGLNVGVDLQYPVSLDWHNSFDVTVIDFTDDF